MRSSLTAAEHTYLHRREEHTFVQSEEIDNEDQ
jgi:hypothetical protein